MTNTTQPGETRARIGAGAIACYSVFRRIHSLMRPYKFADPLRREFAYIMMNSLHELAPGAAHADKRSEHSLLFSLFAGNSRDTARPPPGICRRPQ